MPLPGGPGERCFPEEGLFSHNISYRPLTGTLTFRYVHIFKCLFPPGKPAVLRGPAPHFSTSNKTISHDLSLTRPEVYRHLFLFVHDNLRVRSSGPGAAIAPAVLEIRSPGPSQPVLRGDGQPSRPCHVIRTRWCSLSEDSQPALRHIHDPAPHSPAPLPPGERPRRRAGDL